MDVTFRTDTGVVVPAVTTDEMREIDRIAIEETGPNLFQMMENAGRSLASVAISMLGPPWREASIVVLAGIGGNGGGGIAAGRHLANRGGRVRVAITEPDRLGVVPRAQLDLFDQAGGSRSRLSDIDDADLVVDAVIGYSLRDAPRGASVDFIAASNASGAPILALDVPSGVDAATGAVPGDAVSPAVTMTLALPKTGLAIADTGDVLLADIGIPASAYQRLGRPLHGAIFDDRWIVPITLDRRSGSA